MTKSALNTLAGAAALLIMSAQIASAGSDGTCPGMDLDELAAVEISDASTPIPSTTAAADYTKVAQAATDKAPEPVNSDY